MRNSVGVIDSTLAGTGGSALGEEPSTPRKLAMKTIRKRRGLNVVKRGVTQFIVAAHKPLLQRHHSFLKALEPEAVQGRVTFMALRQTVKSCHSFFSEAISQAATLF